MTTSLQPGSTISRYRVHSSLGAGGMGEVYLARDETLGRNIALKILPPELVANGDRVKRFVQEAKSASSLSHPHIVTIHEIGQAENPGGGPPIHFIAMELVEGSTLRELIHGDRTELRTLLRYLAQAADGLSKAHAAGIVHRDLKPDNIMVTKDGYAKVLDFGLAKLTERQVISPDERTSAPTETEKVTGEGAVLGTVGYMSPEQAQGKPADHRSDIFSFGCILYETATRTKPFIGDSDIEVLHKILKDQPAPVEEINAQVPAEVRRLIRRCLAKNPDQRAQSMKDLAVELGEIVETYDSLAIGSDSRWSTPRISRPAITVGVRPRLDRTVAIAAMVVLGLAGLIAGGWALTHPSRDARTAAPSSRDVSLTRLASFPDMTDATLSPDRRFLAYTREQQGKHTLWVRQIATGSDIEVIPPQQDYLGDVWFSGDGNYVYYCAADPQRKLFRSLFEIPALGGTPRKVLFDVDSRASFSPDGRQVVFLRDVPSAHERHVILANADGSGERKLLTRALGTAFAPPVWSPDGKRLATAWEGIDGGLHSDVVEISPVNGEYRSIGRSGLDLVFDLVWLPDGSGLVMLGGDFRSFIQSQLWLVPYPDGTPRKITNDLNTYAGISVSADSKALSTLHLRNITNLWVAPLTEASQAKQITFATSNEDAVDQICATPSGTIVFRSWRGGGSHVWSIRPDGSALRRLTPEDLDSFYPHVARKAGFALFTARRASEKSLSIWRVDPDGGNLVQVATNEGASNVSPDGATMLLQKTPGLWAAPVSGGAPVKLADESPGYGEYSPDGRFVAFSVVRNDSGRIWRELEFVPSSGGASVRTIARPEGTAIRWAPDGEALLYNHTESDVDNIWRFPLAGGAPRQITNFKSGRIEEFDVTPDGKTLVFTRADKSADAVLITNFR